MDMKKILSTIDGANTSKPDSSEMKKFVSIVQESNNRLSMAEQMAVQHYQEPRKDITNPVLNKDKDAKPTMIGKYFKQIEEEISESKQRYQERATQLAERVSKKINDKNTDVKSKIKKSSSKTTSKPVVTAESVLEELKVLRDSINERIASLEEYYSVPPTDSKSPIPGRHVDGCQCKEVEEGLKDPKDNPCWKGYKPVGTKKKNGRTVPNCVPK